MRAQLGHLVAERQHDRDGAQRAEDPADSQGVADRLAQAVGGRDLEVEQGGRVAADLDHVDHVVGAVERAAAVEMGLDARLCAERRGGVAGHRLGDREPLGIDVVKRDLAVAQLGEREDVAQQVLGELDASRTHEDDSWHD